MPDAPATPEPEVKPKPKAKTKANANKRQKVEPSTPLEKRTDLAEKLLAKVTRTSPPETQLIVCPFAEKLLDEIRAGPPFGVAAALGADFDPARPHHRDVNRTNKPRKHWAAVQALVDKKVDEDIA